MAEILCPHCMLLHPAEAVFCPITGKAISAPPEPLVKRCARCQTVLQPDWLACPTCGQLASVGTAPPAGSAYPPTQTNYPNYPPPVNRAASPGRSGASSGRKWLVCGSLGLLGVIGFILIACLSTILLLGLGENNRTARMLPADDTQALITFSPTLMQLPSLIYSDRLQKSLGVFGAIPGASDLASLAQVGIFQDLQIDPRTDILPWIGNEVSMAVLGDNQSSGVSGPDAPVAYNPGANHQQMGTGVLLTAATRSKGISDAFFNRMYRQMQAAGATIDTYEYSNVEITTVNDPGSYTTLYVATHRGLVLISPMQGMIEAAIDSAGKPRTSLYEQDQYQQIMKQLPANRVGMMYVDLAALGLNSGSGSGLDGMLLGSMQSIGGSFSLEASGLRFDYLVKYDARQMPADQLKMLKASATRNQLLKNLPEDAVFYLSGQDLSLSARTLFGLYAGGMDDIDSTFEYAQNTFGVDLQTEFLDHLTGEYSIAFVPVDSSSASSYMMGFVFSAQMDDQNALEKTVETLMQAVATDGSLNYYTDESGGARIIGVRDSDVGEEIAFVLKDNVLHLALSSTSIDQLVAGSRTSLANNNVVKRAMNALPSKERQYIVIDVGGVVDYLTSQMSEAEVQDFRDQYGEYVQDLESLSMSIGQMDSSGIIHGQVQINTR